jgi:DNA-directed RNA polymerase subunit M/transcription elongation factor TFIIS
MNSVRHEIANTLSSFLPTISDDQVADLERSIFNVVIRGFKDRVLDPVWCTAFEDEYRRLAAEMVGELTQEEGYSNGNRDLMSRVHKGEVDIANVPFMPSQERRPEVYVDVTSDTRELARVTDKFMGTRSTIYECPKCQQNNCTYTELQIRSADEGTTTFVTCLDCGHKWAFGG